MGTRHPALVSKLKYYFAYVVSASIFLTHKESIREDVSYSNFNQQNCYNYFCIDFVDMPFITRGVHFKLKTAVLYILKKDQLYMAVHI